MRGFSFMQNRMGKLPEYDTPSFPMSAVSDRNDHFAAMMDAMLPNVPRVLEGTSPAVPRELMVMRLVSASDLANQTYNGASAMGFGVLYLTKRADARAYKNAQINKATFFVNSGSNLFTNVSTVDLDRNIRLGPHDATNPIQKLFVLK